MQNKPLFSVKELILLCKFVVSITALDVIQILRMDNRNLENNFREIYYMTANSTF